MHNRKIIAWKLISEALSSLAGVKPCDMLETSSILLGKMKSVSFCYQGVRGLSMAHTTDGVWAPSSSSKAACKQKETAWVGICLYAWRGLRRPCNRRGSVCWQKFIGLTKGHGSKSRHPAFSSRPSVPPWDRPVPFFGQHDYAVLADGTVTC